MTEAKMKAYPVRVVETYTKSVIVYAESPSAAIWTVDELSSRGELGREGWRGCSREVTLAHKGRPTVKEWGELERIGF